jgi:hypothetical protein
MTVILGSFELVRNRCKKRDHFTSGFLTTVRNGYSQVHLNLGAKPISVTVSGCEKPIPPPLRGGWLLTDQTFTLKTCKAQGVAREHF